jgi:hypothetical protein
VEGSCVHGTFRLHNILGSFSVAAQLAASQEGLSSKSESYYIKHNLINIDTIKIKSLEMSDKNI